MILLEKEQILNHLQEKRDSLQILKTNFMDCLRQLTLGVYQLKQALY